MDVAFILDKYFKGKANVSIDVFDAQTLNAVYQDVVNAMTSHLDIEISVLQALSYCRNTRTSPRPTRSVCAWRTP